MWVDHICPQHVVVLNWHEVAHYFWNMRVKIVITENINNPTLLCRFVFLFKWQ